MHNQTDKKPTRVITISRQKTKLSEVSEIVRLAESCDYQVLSDLTLSSRNPKPDGLPGKGKLSELARLQEASDCDFFIIDYELSPSRKQIFEKGAGLPVMTRTELILEVFARRAKTSIARQQVELARLEYLFSNLEGGYVHLLASQGGSGFRGPGETQIELDRRLIKKRIAKLRRRLKAVRVSRNEQRKRRRALPQIALCGYTNAGKTSLLNRLAQTDLPAEDRLFASLDPIIRKVYNPFGQSFLLADTVGFIRDLPHNLIEAFISTLEEVAYADLILIVFDAADPTNETQIAVVEEVLTSIGADKIARFYCANKIDKLEDKPWALSLDREKAFPISALSGEGLEDLLKAIHRVISRQSTQALS